LLALLVLFSTLSFTIEKHYCGDHLVDVSYFGNTKKCTDEIEDDGCDTPEVEQKKNCCKDEVQHVEGQENLKNSVEKFDLKKQQFTIAFITSYYNLFVDYVAQTKFYENYSPPNLIQDLQVLLEVYII